MYPRIGRLIPPGFGLPWSDEGAFTNPDPTRRALAEDMVIRSFAESERVMSEKVGEGHVIFWTGPDGICWRRLVDGKDIRLGHKLNPKLKEWNHVVSGLADAIKKSRARGYVKTKLLFEPKFAGDPCWIDVFTDTELAILGINQINKLVGEKVVWWQDEFCHARGGGRTFTNALRQAIKADVFDGNIHLNSGQLGRVDFAKLLARRGGTLLSEFPPAVDPDFLPGQGVQEWVADQVDTIWLCNHWSAKTGKPAEIEFDARFARHADTIGELEKSARWVIGVFNDATALPSVDHG
ncbi:MAG: hypothetical protein NT077_01020 [Candidatus Taylorbacteria bacterium]|nr:hypothetical protein [Candidatus Taylorbacteria bacterium]